MATIFGTPLADNLNGTNGDDSIFGLAGNDMLSGLASNDRLYGGKGNDTLRGGDGKDTIFGGLGNDSLNGGYGSDRLFGSDGKDRIFGSLGNDEIYGGKGNDYLEGSGISSNLTDDTNITYDDRIFGGDGNDILNGSFGNDTLNGGAGNDTLNGAEGLEVGLGTSQGIDEIDVLTGGTGADIFLLQGAGNFSGTFPLYAFSGESDYGLITDFNTSEDIISLASATGEPIVQREIEYSLGAAPSGLPEGTGIFATIAGNDLVPGIESELIAILQNVSPDSISLSDPYFNIA